MPDIVRVFKIPSNLDPGRRRLLADACGALQARQHAFAVGASAAVAAREVALEADTLKLVYRLAGGRPLTAEAPAADSARLRDRAHQVCSILAAAYPEGRAAVLRHGGLCRDNVVLDDQGRVRILDFGVAECISGALDPFDDSFVRQVCATAAPELWTHPAGWGQHSDIFAAGVLLYELATGVHPLGARAADPEDCKFRALTELPALPAARNPALDARLSRTIHGMIRREAQERYASFQAVLADLSLAPEPVPAPAPRPVSPAAPATPQPAADAEARRRYLQEQERLKQLREEADQRQAQRRRQRQTAVAALSEFVRRHAWALALATCVCVAAVSTLTVLGIRLSHHVTVGRALNQLNEQLSTRFRSGDGHLLALTLDLPPERRLVSAFEDLHKVAPGTAPAFGDPVYGGLLHDVASTPLRIAQSDLLVPLKLDGSSASGVRLELDAQQLSEVLIQTSERLALEQLPAAVLDLARSLRQALGAARTAEEAEDALRPQLAQDAVAPLGYLAAQGEKAVLALGAFKPIPGETGLRAEAALTALDGQDILQEPVELRLRLAAAADGDGAWSLAAVEVVPQREPLTHKLWCMNNTLSQIRAAFDARDEARLAELTHPDDRPQIERMLEWVGRCVQAALFFQPIQVAADQVQVTVEFDSGSPGAGLRYSAPVTLQFDSGRDWRIRPDRTYAWPDAPPALRRLEQGRALVERLRQAWTERNPADYLALFENHRRSIEGVQAMFTQMDEDQVVYEIAAREDSADENRLLIEARPQADPQQARRGHTSKTFGFEMDAAGTLRWDRREDPLWVFAGRHFESLVRRLRVARWHGLAEIERDFEQTSARDMSTLERDKIERWIAALREAREMFDPLSEEQVAGFPQRTALRQHGQGRLTFRLVALPGADSRVVYMQERELQRDDLATFWTGGEPPWSRWEKLVGPTPDGQAVGLSLAEARDVARQMGCTLPDTQEWQAAAAAAGDTAAAPSEQLFHGGVWEFCDQQAPGEGPVAIGGCWYDFDPELVEAGLPPLAQRPLLINQERFGTVGLRLCKRFPLPPEALAVAE